MSGSKQQQELARTDYEPPGMVPFVFAGFNGVNTDAARTEIEEDQCAWMDGFMPLGKSTARTMPGVGPITFSFQGGTITFIGSFNINFTPYLVIIINNGGIWVVNTETNVATQIAANGTITNPVVGQMGISQWGAQFLLIVANQTNGYWAWDGTTFYAAGASVPGFTTMPTGVSGTSIETYQSRVWISSASIIIFSAPGSLTDFATSDGGGIFQSVDSFLRAAYIQLRQSNGFLYLIGDSSINYISQVQTSTGTPPVTTFSNQNANPEIGTPYAATVDVFSRNIIFANAFGVHISYGGAVSKISDMLDGVYGTVPNFGGMPLSSCKAIVYSKRLWMVLVPIIDSISAAQVNKLFCWDGKRWWTTQQDENLTYVASQEFNSVLTAYGTDGVNVWPLFQQPSTGFTKTLRSKLWYKPGYWHEKSADRLWGIAIYFNANDPNLTVTIDGEINVSPETVVLGPSMVTWVNNSGQTVTWTNMSSSFVTWPGSGTGVVVFPPTAVGQNGAMLGLTITTSAADVEVMSFCVGGQVVEYRG